MNKLEAIRCLMKHVRDTDLLVCCNGMIGRELYTVQDRPSNFYMIGSMGLGLSIGLGLALSQPSRRVIVLDGDGNVLMGMNALASVGSEAPKNLTHVVLDNHTHASTGGQRTISTQVHLEEVARAVGYRNAVRAEGLDAFDRALGSALENSDAVPDTAPTGMAQALVPYSIGPTLVLTTVEGGTIKGIGRVEPTPPELAERFRKEACR